MDAPLPPSTAGEVRAEITRSGVRAVAIVVAYFLLPFEDGWMVTALLAALIVAGLFPFAIRRFKRVLASERPMVDAVNALLITLVTLLVSFAAIYQVMETRNPGAFGGMDTKLDALYFEMTMMSTVGFGDITALSQSARAVVTANMVLNLLYIGTTVRLLTWAVRRHGMG